MSIEKTFLLRSYKLYPSHVVHVQIRNTVGRRWTDEDGGDGRDPKPKLPNHFG